MKRNCIIAVFTLLILFLSFSLPTYASETDALRPTVRVGFFHMDKYNEIDEAGNKSGYGYETMEFISSYTNWNVEYVGYDLDWKDMIEMIDNNEIDFLLDVSYTKEREDKYLFSASDMGSTHYALSVRNDDSRFETGNANEINGITVGAVENTSSVEFFYDYSKRNGFSTNVITFKNIDDMYEALWDKSVDAILTSAYDSLQNKRELFIFYNEPIYIITNKNNETRMDELNVALNNALLYHPDFFTDLYNKYYQTSNNSGIFFTRDEKEYIENNKERVYKAAVLDNNAPISYKKNGTPSGIIIDYIDEIEKVTGLTIEPVFYTDRSFYQKDIESKKVDLVFDLIYDYNFANSLDVKIIDEYISLPSSIIFMKDNTNSNEKLKIGTCIDLPDYVLKNTFSLDEESDYSISMYEDTNELISELKNMNISVGVLPAYSAEYFCYQDIIGQMSYSLLGDFSIDLAVANVNVSDSYLYSILNKAISDTKDVELNHLIFSNNQYGFDGFSLIVYLRQNPFALWGITLVFFLFLMLICIFLVHSFMTKQEKELAEENFNYFKTVLASNLYVYEVRYKDGERSEIYYEPVRKPDGTISSVTKINNVKSFNYYLDLIHPSDRDIFLSLFSKENINEMFNHMSSCYRELRMQDFYGKYFYIGITLQPNVKKDGDNRSFMILVKDIDSVKSKEEEKRKTLSVALDTAKRFNESKTLFMSQMSHDIRTPLNAIVGMTSIAKINLDNTEKVVECLNVISNSSDHLLSLVNSILDVSKIEKGELKLNSLPINVKNVAEMSIAMIIGKASKNGLSLFTHFDEIKHIEALGDSTRLEQVFNNIISNAVKYTNPGGIVDISLNEMESNRKDCFFYQFVVKDTGIGMDSETLRKIYQPFERGKGVEAVEGSGLGMAITKSIIDAMGGIIHVESEVNVGTEVSISFHLKATEQNRAENKNDGKKEIRSIGNGRKILIVEDVEINAMFAEAIVEMKGFVPEIAENGEEAVKKLKASEDGYYSMVLMDIQMPVMNGYEASRIIRRSTRKYLKSIPIIAMSANTFPEDILKCKDAGMNDHISKPIDVNRFSDVVDHFLTEDINEEV